MSTRSVFLILTTALLVALGATYLVFKLFGAI